MALASAASFFFLVLISTTYGDIYKTGDVVKVTCPKVQDSAFPNGYVIPPNFIRESTDPAIDDKVTIILSHGNIPDVNNAFCRIPAEKEKCDMYKNRTEANEITMGSGVTVSAIEYSYTVAAADGGFTLKCDISGTFQFPDGYSAQSRDMTVVDPANLELTVDANATSGGLAEGEKIDATCKIARQGSGSLDLVMYVGTEELTELSISTNGNEVSASTTDSHAAKRGYNGKTVECYIKVSGAQWGAVKQSGALNVLFAPYDVKAGQEIYLVETEGVVANKAVTCSAMAGNPPTFEWSVIVKDENSDTPRGTDDVIDSQTGGDTKDYSVVVKVDNTDLDVQCIVKNSVGNASATAKIEIIRAPKISGIEVWVNGTKEDATVHLGADRKATLTLRCVARPSSATIEWSKFGNDEPITEGVSGTDLTLDVTHENDNDAYICKASVPDLESASEKTTLWLAYPVEAEITEGELEGGGKKITIVANGNLLSNGLRDAELDVKRLGSFFKNIQGKQGDSNKVKTFEFDLPKEELNQTFTFEIENWRKEYKVEPWATPIEPTSEPQVAIGSGAIAGIIIAIILIVLCAILLVVMWQKGLLCAKEPPTKTGAGANSTAASTAGALDYAEQGYASADELNEVPGGGGVVNPAGPVNSMNGYPPAPQNPDNAPYYAPAPQNPDNAPYYAPAVHPTPDNMGGGGGGGDEYTGIGGETDMENNLQPGVKDADRMSDDSGVERNGHLPPETGV